MATEVVLEKNGIVRSGYIGFCWTVFFFGFIPMLFRKDFKGFIITLVLQMIFSFILRKFHLDEFIGVIIFDILLGFFYNKYHLNSLLLAGWTPSSESDREVLRGEGYSF